MVTWCWISDVPRKGSLGGLPMVKVPDGIRTNSIPKVLVYFFSKEKAETEKKLLPKTMTKHTLISFFN
jgi:hypothetical protein